MDEANLEELTDTDPAAPSTRSIGCGFWMLWLIATILGSGIGWLAGWWVSYEVSGELGTLFLGVVTGLVLGVAQWLVLRAYLPGAGWWIASSTLGWGTGFFGGVLLAHSAGQVELGFSLMLGATVGLCSGVAQWLVLRRVSSYAGWWVLASLFCWTTAFIYFAGGLSLRGAFFGLLVGIVSGWALVGILNFPGKQSTLAKSEF